MWAATETLIERHLEDILNNNRQAVIGAFQTEIKKTLKTQNHRKKASKVNCCKQILISHFMLPFFVTKIYSFAIIAVLVINIVKICFYIILILSYSVFYVDLFELCMHICCGRTKRSCFLPLRSSSVLLSVSWAAAVISSLEMPVWTAWRYEKNAYSLLNSRQIIIIHLMYKCLLATQGCFAKTVQQLKPVQDNR